MQHHEIFIHKELRFKREKKKKTHAHAHAAHTQRKGTANGLNFDLELLRLIWNQVAPSTTAIHAINKQMQTRNRVDESESKEKMKDE